MATPGFSGKAKRAAIQRSDYARQQALAEHLSPGSTIRKRRVNPRERAWANAYLKHVAELKGLPYRSVRESMQVIGRYFEIEVATTKEKASRSQVAIDLANKIQAATGIQIPNRR